MRVNLFKIIVKKRVTAIVSINYLLPINILLIKSRNKSFGVIIQKDIIALHYSAMHFFKSYGSADRRGEEWCAVHCSEVLQQLTRLQNLFIFVLI